jgi:hypothetical protein
MAGTDPSTAVSLPEHVLLQKMHTGEAMMLNLEDESYFGLDEVAARMVEILSSSETFDGAVGVLVAEYDTDPATLRRDMEELVETLRSRDLVRVA